MISMSSKHKKRGRASCRLCELNLLPLAPFLTAPNNVSKQFLNRLFNRSHTNNAHSQQSFHSSNVRRRNHYLLETQCLRRFYTRCSLQGTSHFARQSHFAENRRVWINRHVLKTRGDRRNDAEIY